MNDQLPVYDSCRVILVDSNDRVLLLEHAINSALTVWVPPGGGVEPGESFADAARRELWDETGLRAEDLGPLLWVRESVFPHTEGKLTSFVERYFLYRIREHDIGGHLNTDERERANILGHRWWHVSDIEQSDALFGPQRLAELLKPVLAGRLPAEPIQLEPAE